VRQRQTIFGPKYNVLINTWQHRSSCSLFISLSLSHDLYFSLSLFICISLSLSLYIYIYIYISISHSFSWPCTFPLAKAKSQSSISRRGHMIRERERGRGGHVWAYDMQKQVFTFFHHVPSTTQMSIRNTEYILWTCVRCQRRTGNENEGMRYNGKRLTHLDFDCCVPR
jgi:hypothetical protein